MNWVVALLGGRRAEVLETFVRVVESVEAGAPVFLTKRDSCDDVIEALELAVLAGEQRVDEGVAVLDKCRRVVVQNHVHACQAGGDGIFFLPVQRDPGAGLFAYFHQQRSRATNRVVNRGVVTRDRTANTMICAMMRLTSAGI